MDEFSVQVDREDVKPLIWGFEEKLPQIDIRNAEFYLYKIPPKQDIEEAHQKRLLALSSLRSKEILRLESFLKRQNALPVVKIKTSRASYIVKPTHSHVWDKVFDKSQKNIRFERYVSELADQLGIGPKFYDAYYFNPRMLLMVEECISKDSGWNAMYRYAGRLDLEVFPKILGEIIGKLHKSNHWKTYDNHELEGYLWYHERVFLHLFCNSKTGLLRLIDFGNAELIFPERFKEDKLPISKLSWDVENTARDLVDYAFPFKRGIKHKNADEYKEVFNKFCEAYHKETGIYVKPGDLMWRIRSRT